MLIIFVLFLIIFEAIHEALYDNNHKTLSGIIEFVYLSVITLSILSWLRGLYIFDITYIPFIKIVLGYLFLRFALFDAVYNLLRNLPLFYVGDTKLFDKILTRFFKWTGFPKEHFLAMIKICLLCVGITFLIP